MKPTAVASAPIGRATPAPRARICAALLVAALALASAACRGGAPPQRPADEPARTSAPEPAQKRGCDPQPVPEGDFELLGDPRACIGGRIVLETNSYPTHLNYYGPERSHNIKREYVEAMFNTLVSVNLNTLQIVPELASSWTDEGPGRVITFNIDPDAKWSDGKPITSADVLATWDLVHHPKVVETALKLLFEASGFSKPEALDERTVRFTSTKPQWSNILLIAEDFPIYPAHAVNPETYLEEWRFSVPVVSGQYTLGAHASGEIITFVRRPDFWGLGKRQFVGTGNFDEITRKVITDNDVAYEHFKKGDIDVYLVTKAQRWIEETDFDKVQKGWIQKTKMYHREPQVSSQWAFNLNHPLFSDVRVRKALAYLMDREYLHDQLFYNQYVNKDSYWANSIYENPANERITFSPEKGLALLAEAGWTQKDADGTLMKDGRRFEFKLLYIHPTATRVYTPLQETYRKYGIRMNLEMIQPSAWIKVSQEKNFELIYANWGPLPFPQPRDQWHSTSADVPDTSNITRFKDPRVDALIEQYEVEPDFTRRAALMREIDVLIHPQFPYLLDWYSDNFRMLWWDKLGMPEWMSYAMEDIRQTEWKTWWFEPERAQRLEAAMQAGTSVPLHPPEIRWWKDGPGARWHTAAGAGAPATPAAAPPAATAPAPAAPTATGPQGT